MERKYAVVKVIDDLMVIEKVFEKDEAGAIAFGKSYAEAHENISVMVALGYFNEKGKMSANNYTVFEAWPANRKE